MAYALITGASAGLGQQFALELAKQGRHLILVARSEDRLNRLASELTEAYSVQVIVIPLDLSRLEAAETLLKHCQKHGLEIDLLVNNAGFGLMGAFESQDLGKIQEMLLLNVVSLTKLIHLFLPILKRNQGAILNVASTAGFQPLPYTACYSATKSYVLDFSEAITVELKHEGIPVTTLCPGPTETSFFEAAQITSSQVRMPKMSAHDVVKAGLKGLERRKSLVIPGWLNKFLVFSVRLGPRFLVLKIGQFLMGH